MLILRTRMKRLKVGKALLSNRLRLKRKTQTRLLKRNMSKLRMNLMRRIIVKQRLMIMIVIRLIRYLLSRTPRLNTFNSLKPNYKTSKTKPKRGTLRISKIGKIILRQILLKNQIAMFHYKTNYKNLLQIKKRIVMELLKMMIFKFRNMRSNIKRIHIIMDTVMSI